MTKVYHEVRTMSYALSQIENRGGPSGVRHSTVAGGSVASNGAPASAWAFPGSGPGRYALRLLPWGLWQLRAGEPYHPSALDIRVFRTARRSPCRIFDRGA